MAPARWCPAHSTLKVHNYLQNIFQDRIMSGRGSIVWPARSPDLSPNDFFLWGYIKARIYNNVRLNNIDELKDRISIACREINPAF